MSSFHAINAFLPDSRRFWLVSLALWLLATAATILPPCTQAEVRKDAHPIEGEQVAPGLSRTRVSFARSVIMPDRDGFVRRQKSLPALPPLVDPVSVSGRQEWTGLLVDDFEAGLLYDTWSLQYIGEGPWWDDWTCWSTSGSPKSTA